MIFPRLARWLTCATGLAASVLLADSVQPIYDAFCAAPKLRLAFASDADSVGVLEGSESLETPDWQPLLQLGSISGHHEWMDPENRAKARRFYRLSRSPPVSYTHLTLPTKA